MRGDINTGLDELSNTKNLATALQCAEFDVSQKGFSLLFKAVQAPEGRIQLKNLSPHAQSQCFSAVKDSRRGINFLKFLQNSGCLSDFIKYLHPPAIKLLKEAYADVRITIDWSAVLKARDPVRRLVASSFFSGNPESRPCGDSVYRKKTVSSPSPLAR